MSEVEHYMEATSRLRAERDEALRELAVLRSGIRALLAAESFEMDESRTAFWDDDLAKLAALLDGKGGH